MADLLIKVVFSILNFISRIFLSPIISVVSSVIPVLTNFFTGFLTFINYGLQYTSFFIKLLMVPKAPLVVLITFFVGIFAFNLTIRAVGLGMAIYHYFKP